MILSASDLCMKAVIESSEAMVFPQQPAWMLYQRVVFVRRLLHIHLESSSHSWFDNWQELLEVCWHQV